MRLTDLEFDTPFSFSRPESAISCWDGSKTIVYPKDIFTFVDANTEYAIIKKDISGQFYSVNNIDYKLIEIEAD